MRQPSVGGAKERQRPLQKDRALLVENVGHPPFDIFFFLNDRAPPEIYPLPLPAPLPISDQRAQPRRQRGTPAPAPPGGVAARAAHGRAPADRADAHRAGHAIDRRARSRSRRAGGREPRSEEHTSELQSQSNLVCRLLLEK